MRTPTFMQGVAAKPSRPATFGAIPAHPERSLHAVQAESKGVSFTPPQPVPTPPPPAAQPSPPQPVAIPAALTEFRPPPSPPPPPFMQQPQNNEAIKYALEKLGMQNERLAELARSDALEIGFIVAERILEQEVAHNPRALMSLVRSAMRRLSESRQMVITVSAADAEKIKASNEAGIANVKIEIDPTFGPGDVKVSSELGVVDGRVQTRLADLRKALDSNEEES